jgi:hypothetical protein
MDAAPLKIVDKKLAVLTVKLIPSAFWGSY